MDLSRYDDPFVFATFRALCAWLAEETSCLKEEIMALLPFLIGYTKHHLRDKKGKGLADWMSKMAVTDGSQAGTWTGEHVLRSEILLKCALYCICFTGSSEYVQIRLHAECIVLYF